MKRSAVFVAMGLLWSMTAAGQEPVTPPETEVVAQREETSSSPGRVTSQEPVAAEEPAPEEPTAAAAAEPAAGAEAAAEEPPVEVIEEPQFTRFVVLNDALPARFFNAVDTAADPACPDRLLIALHTGLDPATFKANDFRASTGAFSHLSAVDTISFRIEAPKGQRIAKVIYTQRGNGSQVRLGRAAGATHWVVGDYAAQIGMFSTNPSLVGVADFTQQPQAAVDVSITTALFAFAPPTSGSASVEVTSADVQVELVPATDPF